MPTPAPSPTPMMMPPAADSQPLPNPNPNPQAAPNRPGDPLRQIAMPLRWMFWCLAGLWVLDHVIQPTIYLQDPRFWLHMVLSVGGGLASLLAFAAFILAGNIADRCARFWADRIDARASWESQLLDRLHNAGSFATVSPASASPQGSKVSGSVAADSPATPYDAIRRELAAQNALKALELANALIQESPDDAEALALISQAEQLKVATIADLRSQIAAAKEIRDTDQILTLRDELAPFLAQEERRELDQGLVRWLMKLFQNKLRAGVINADIASLAARIAQVFAEYPEGASMRAGLPTLRRSAGLCPRCAEPYRGIDNACPKCMTAEAAKKIGAETKGIEP